LIFRYSDNGQPVCPSVVLPKETNVRVYSINNEVLALTEKGIDEKLVVMDPELDLDFKEVDDDFILPEGPIQGFQITPCGSFLELT